MRSISNLIVYLGGLVLNFEQPIYLNCSNTYAQYVAVRVCGSDIYVGNRSPSIPLRSSAGSYSLVTFYTNSTEYSLLFSLTSNLIVVSRSIS